MSTPPSISYNYSPITNRPARKQTEGYTPFTPNRSGDYNIWYHRYSGFESKQTRGDRGDVTRCCIDTDAGTTSALPNAPLCIHFALGKCFRGSSCTYRHQVPQDDDEKRLGVTQDVFGRDRHMTDRADMGGVGRFSKENRTLYVTGFKGNLPPQKLEELLKRHFSEWGKLEYIRVLPVRNIAFVRYHLRAAAEFAKVAMADQSLDNNEKLNVRWAYDDPNPIAKAVEEQNVAAQYVELVKEKIAEKRMYSANVDLPPEKRQMVTYGDSNIQFKYNIKSSSDNDGSTDKLNGKSNPSATSKVSETDDSKDVAKDKKDQSYAPNKYTGYLHPYTYGFFYPKQAELARKADDSESESESKSESNNDVDNDIDIKEQPQQENEHVDDTTQPENDN